MIKRIAAVLTVFCALWQGACAQGVMLGVQVKDTPSPAPTASAAPVQEATPSEAEEASFEFREITAEEIEAAGLGERILMRGMEGEDVALMQRRLYQLGYYLGEIDGVFGLRTRTSVYAFQRAHKLEKIDGKVGPETIGRMFAQDAVVKPTPTPTPTPTPSPTPQPTPTPVSTPVPTPVPDAAGAPFAMQALGMYIGDKPVELMAGTDTDGEILYPLCGVLSHMGYAYSCDGMSSWQLLRETDGSEIVMMTDGSDGAQPMAMGSFDGVLFLADENSRVYAYAQEAYVAAPVLEMIGMTVLLVSGTPVIH